MRDKNYQTLPLILVFLLFLSGIWFYLDHSLPSDETVKQEFLKRNSDLENAEIQNVELIFEYAEKETLVDLIKFKKSEIGEILTDEFAMKQGWNFQWQWCSDQTESKCIEKINHKSKIEIYEDARARYLALYSWKNMNKFENRFLIFLVVSLLFLAVSCVQPPEQKPLPVMPRKTQTEKSVSVF